ncbi:alpha/beta hydrolase [Mucilaginibacter rubeus]|uniref:Alpha/beta hydrolase n=1 Tax=Mucilaginibacter rubeus TaxID=2027860 RepID=A0AAE6MHV1_9SPHI|nr:MULTISPECIES: alpha/beta hydrolase [Mucilaginibacter]QEM03619.1 alpha/beta hydrolase [Mucilaginibacter rubeus]QEM16230.1 alpha/beta hydrolase [Mucilaginibacter gossypii]QTE41011.1 alpha/beta hydrolase [Mucilaginibacter rubeus]QTE47614.1 alpha/beta hydrolase [Mucilaginibacter rubeus]QTE59005.1 alpha/beta hydrolase [Mucilaginibacter rubeus]
MENQTQHKYIQIKGVNIFYREAGPKDAPVLVLLHGYPSSSHMFRNLIADLSDKYHLIAADYPGYGRSEQPPIKDFDYTFDNFAVIIEELLETLGINKYSLYLMDYGAPVGWRLAYKHPERIDTLIVQNGCAYDEGLEAFWDPIKAYWKDKNDLVAEETLKGFHSPDGLKWQYTHGVPDASVISPDNWEIDLRHLERPENGRIQLDLFYDYQTNVTMYPQWQEYFRTQNPEMLIVYGKNDYIFPVAGAEAYKKDVKNLEYHLFDAGHFALESSGTEIAGAIRDFLDRKVKRN